MTQKLATLFQNVDEKIYSSQCNGNLKIQKITYLAQEYGVDFGYEFAWNRNGPYCKQLSDHARDIIESGADENADWNKKLQKFVKMIKPYINDAEWLEISASLLYLYKDSYVGKSLEQITGYLMEDLEQCHKNFGHERVRKVINDMTVLGIFEW